MKIIQKTRRNRIINHTWDMLYMGNSYHCPVISPSIVSQHLFNVRSQQLWHNFFSDSGSGSNAKDNYVNQNFLNSSDHQVPQEVSENRQAQNAIHQTTEEKEKGIGKDSEEGVLGLVYHKGSLSTGDTKDQMKNRKKKQGKAKYDIANTPPPH